MNQQCPETLGKGQSKPPCFSLDGGPTGCSLKHSCPFYKEMQEIQAARFTLRQLCQVAGEKRVKRWNINTISWLLAKKGFTVDSIRKALEKTTK